MSFLPGRFLDPDVSKQVSKRQEVLGNRERLIDGVDSFEAYSFFNKKVPFIKLTSGIDKGEFNEKTRKVDNPTSTFAAAAVLDNGYKSATGIVPGYEESETLGFRPQAGITGLQVRTHNRFGSLRTATVQFNCNSVEQLNKYEQVFMRPGYSALLEWGNSIYLDSTFGEVSAVDILLSDSFLNKTITQDIVASSILQAQLSKVSTLTIEELKTLDKTELAVVADSLGYTREQLEAAIKGSSRSIRDTKQGIYDAIEHLRKKYHYNYDAMYGLIKNFSWTIRPDGGYNCTADIVSIGSTIESLTVNAGVTEKEVVSLYNQLEVITPTEAGDEEISSGEIWSQAITEFTTDLTGTLSAIFGGLVSAAVTSDDAPEDLKPFFIGLEDLAERRNNSPDRGSDFKYKVGILPPNFNFDSLNTRCRIYQLNLDETPFTINIRGDYRVIRGTTAGNIDAALGAVVLGPDDPIEDQPVYKLFNNQTFKIGENIEATLEYVDHTFVKESAFLYDIAAFDVRYALRLVDLNTDVDVTDGGSSLTASELIKQFAPQYSSRIHLYLYALQVAMQKKVGDDLYYEKKVNQSEILLDSFITSSYNTLAARKRVVLDGDEPQPPHHTYIQLGYLLDILNHYIPDSGESREPLFKFHTNTKLKHGFKTFGDRSPNHHASVDIAVCLLPNSYPASKTKRDDILNIFLEIDYVCGVLDQTLSTGELRLYETVTQIIGDVARVTGGINGYDLQYFEDTFTFHVVDREVLDPAAQTTSAPVLDLVGKNSMLRSLNITSKLSPAISTQIAIAAQASPHSSTIEGTMFERFNKGLIDRYIPEKKTFNDKELERLAQQDEDRAKKLQEQLSVAYRYLRLIYGGSTFTGLKAKVPGAVAEYTVLCKKLLEQEMDDKSFGGIIPFELSMTIEGMSGFQVMESFLINQSIIPDSYKGSGDIAFLITGLDNRVDMNGWVTTVKAQIYQFDQNKRAPIYPLVGKQLDLSDTGELNIQDDGGNTGEIENTDATIEGGVTYKGIRWEVGRGHVVKNSTRDANVKTLIDVMEEEGITNKYAQVGILAVVGKECGFVPKNEYSYSGTSIARLRDRFSTRLAHLTDDQVERVKKNNEEFYELIYGLAALKKGYAGGLKYDADGKIIPWNGNPRTSSSWTLHYQKGDGYKYRGRGFNQLTFKGNYKARGEEIGMDLVSNPDKVNEIPVAALIACNFLKSACKRKAKKDINSFASKDDAVYWITRGNAGGREIRGDETYENAVNVARQFEIVA